jgi:hypothetical protein
MSVNPRARLSGQVRQPPERGASGRHTPAPERFSLARTLLLALPAEALVIVWIAHSEIPARVFISSWSVSMPGILLLAGLLLLRRRLPRRAVEGWLGRRQVLGVYIAVSVSGVLTGYSAMQLMFPALGTVIWRADVANRWDRFHPFLPEWLVPHSPEVLKGLFTGNATVPWEAWRAPLIFWTVFLLSLYAAMLFLAALLSRAWIQGERLTFPVAQLPLQMTDPARSVFADRLTWIGFLIPLVLESLIALNYYFPAVPAIELKHKDMGGEWFPDRPFSVLRPFYFGYTPFIVGFAFLAPLDVSFSSWFFSLLAKALRVTGATLGWDLLGSGTIGSRFPFPEEQSFGAFIAFAVAALWRARRHTATDILQESTASQRPVLIGLGGCVAVALMLMTAAGMAPWLAALVLLLMLLVAVTLARIRAEAGPAWAFGPPRDVTRAVVLGLGSATLSPAAITSLSAFRWVSRDARFLPMAFHMEALKIGADAGIRRRSLIALILAATGFGLACGFVVVLRHSYELGWGSGKVYLGPVNGAAGIWNQASNWWTERLSADRAGLPWLTGGAAFTLFLIWMRTLPVWWPFHPIGYVLAETGTGASFWFHYLLAWALKCLILRWGGHRLYARALPFVVGVILGDLLTQTVWSLGAVLLDVPVYQFIS